MKVSKWLLWSAPHVFMLLLIAPIVEKAISDESWRYWVAAVAVGYTIEVVYALVWYGWKKGYI